MQVLVLVALVVLVWEVLEVMAGESVKLKHGKGLATGSEAMVAASLPEPEALLVQLLEEWAVPVAMVGENVKHGVLVETAMVVCPPATAKVVVLLEKAMEPPLVQVVTAAGATKLS